MARGGSRVFILVQVTFVVLCILAAVEYFKYSTRMNYEWFHCTPQLTRIPGTSITQAIATGGPSCDVRGKFKSISKRLSRTFDPNLEPVVFCIKEDAVEGVIGYTAHPDDEEVLKENYCPNIIHW